MEAESIEMKISSAREDIVSMLEECIKKNENVAGAFYWTPSQSASGRRYSERTLSHTMSVTFMIYTTRTSKHVSIKFDLDVSMSCKHVYVHRTTVIAVDGIEKSTNITSIKGWIKKIQEARDIHLL